MKWQRNEAYEDELLQLLWEGIKEDRSGISVTGLIYCLTKAHFEKQAGGIDPDRRTLLFFTTGLALEQVILNSVLEGKQNPVAGEFEGISYHIDNWDEDLQLVDEFKSTRKSMTGFPVGDELSREWHKQFMSYLKMKGTLKGRFIILQVIRPDLIAFDCEYTQEEIDENWEWILERKAVVEEFEKLGKPPTPFMYNESWECKNCTFKMICDVMGEKNERT